jgi:DNA modification methylase
MIKIYNENSLDFMRSEELNDKLFIVVTDPPYNVGYNYNTYKDNLSEEEYYDLLNNILFARRNPFVVIHYPESLYKISFETGLFPDRVVSWVYNSNTPRQHRDIAFFGVKPDFTKVIQPYKNLNDKRIIERIENGIDGGKLYDWWEINQVKNTNDDKYDHPCQIPLEVMKRIIGILPSEYVIVDPFMGTGTTGVACKELGRDFIGIEIDKTYFEIAKDRLNDIRPNGQTSIFTDFSVFDERNK